MPVRDYFSYLLNPLELLRTKKVLQVNPTIASPRKEPEETKLFVYDYDVTILRLRRLKLYQIVILTLTLKPFPGLM